MNRSVMGSIFIAALLFLICISSAATAEANDWYVRPAAAPATYYAEDGSDYINAWNSFNSIDWTAKGIQPGDTLFVCGTHYDLFLEIKGSGASGAKILISGECQDDQGGYDSGVIIGAKIYDPGNALNQITWTETPAGSNIWMSNEDFPKGFFPAYGEQYYSKVPGWVLLEKNGYPACPGRSYNICPTADSQTLSDGKAWWSAGKMMMYMDPDGGGNPRDPADLYSRIIIPNQYPGIYAYDKSYVDITKITVKYVKNHGVWMRGVKHFEVSHMTVTVFGGGKGEAGNSDSGNGIMFDGGGSEYSTVRDSTISEGYDVGLDVELYKSYGEIAHNISFINNTVDRCGGGISISAHVAQPTELHHVYVTNNTFTNLGYGWSGIDNSNKGRGIGIKEFNGSPHPDVHDIYIEGNIVDTYAWLGINMWEGNAEISGNIIRNGTAAYGNDGYSKPAGILVHGGDYVSGVSPYEATGLIKNNLIIDNAGHGIYMINNTPDPLEGDIKIYNNTLVNNGTALYPNFYSVTSSGTFLMNNIIYSTDSIPFSAGAFTGGSTTSDHNVFYRSSGDSDTWWQWGASVYDRTQLSTYKGASFNDSSSHDADPLFINPGANYRPAQNSPAIDTGNAVAEITSDFEGNQVPCGLEADIGAYEYCDTDGDGMHDAFETRYGLNPGVAGDAGTDDDIDGLTNLQEFLAGTDPTDPDSDNDGIADGADTCPLAPPAKITGITQYYSTLQEAYDNTLDLYIILVQTGSYTENISLNLNKTVAFDGGYDCSHKTNTGLTEIIGNITISSGTVTVSDFMLTP